MGRPVLQDNDLVPLTLLAHGGGPGALVTVLIAPAHGDPSGSLSLVTSATEEEHTLLVKPGRYSVTVEALVYRLRRRTRVLEVAAPSTLTVRVGRLGMRVAVDFATEST